MNLSTALLPCWICPATSRRPSPTAWQVMPGRLLALLPAGPAPSLVVERGAAWVTQTGDPRDHLVCPARPLRLAVHGRVVVQALGHEAIAITVINLLHPPRRVA